MEQNVAVRVRIERERRGWSYGEMAERLTAVGCPMIGSTAYKIETSRRKTTISELAGFTTIFGLAPDVLMDEVRDDGEVQAQQLVADMREPWDDVVDRAMILNRLFEALGALDHTVRSDPRELLMRPLEWARAQPDLAGMAGVYNALEGVLDALASVHLGYQFLYDDPPAEWWEETDGERRATP